MSEELVTCKSCAHNRSSWFSRHFGNSIWWTCDRKYIEPRYNPVDGKKRHGYFIDCDVARNNEKVCGQAGYNWKPRNKKDLFIFLKRM